MKTWDEWWPRHMFYFFASSIHPPSIHPCKKYNTTYYVPGIWVDTGDIVLDRAGVVPTLSELTF